MAVLGVEQTADGSWHDLEHGLPARPGPTATVLRILTGPLPEDVLEAEVTLSILFRGSLALNFMTGGAPDMTFSARCHRARRTTRGALPRLAWKMVAVSIDTACAVLRGECEHCAVAWSNHLARSFGGQRR